MPTIVIRHKVADIDVWLQGHEDRIKLFAPAISGFKTYQETTDPGSVTLVVDVTDMEKLTAIINDPKNVAIKAKHTVLEPIIISMPVEL